MLTNQDLFSTLINQKHKKKMSRSLFLREHNMACYYIVLLHLQISAGSQTYIKLPHILENTAVNWLGWVVSTQEGEEQLARAMKADPYSQYSKSELTGSVCAPLTREHLRKQSLDAAAIFNVSSIFSFLREEKKREDMADTDIVAIM